MNIIADIAGRFDELMELLKIMPKDEPILLLGDMVDRGSKSKEVIEWAIKTPNVQALKGNHEDMMIDAYLVKIKELSPIYGYESGIWEINGGQETINSYGKNILDIPKDHIDWLRNLPLFFQANGLFCSHAPWIKQLELGQLPSNPMSAFWNRISPKQRDNVFQIFGHNTVMQTFGDYAICLDDSGHKKLTGIHWPTKQIYQVDYEEVKTEKV